MADRRRPTRRRRERVGSPETGAHEWVSFEDPDEDRRWVFDVTFLLSPWTCIYGRGCRGVLTEPAPELAHGCCSYGAHMTGQADVRRVTAAAKKLTDDQWQLRRRGAKGPFRRKPNGEFVTRMVDGACIFLNRPGFPGGPGCSLHRAALEQGREPLELKPDVCWQLPLRREDAVEADGKVASTVRQWDRADWGPGGSEFDWWCTEASDAFVGGEPVVRGMRAELVAMAGERVYAMLLEYLGRRSVPSTPLPHPAVRRSSAPKARAAPQPPGVASRPSAPSA